MTRAPAPLASLVALAAALVAGLVAASCIDEDLAGRKCNGDHPCVDGFTCVAERCVRRDEVDDDGGVDAGDDEDAGQDDAGRADAGRVDGGADAGPRDGGADAGPANAGDGGLGDAGLHDAGPDDAGPDDAGPDDAGVDDGGRVDGGVDAGPSDAGFPDAGPDDAGFVVTPVFTDTFDGDAVAWDSAKWTVVVVGSNSSAEHAGGVGEIVLGNGNGSRVEATASTAALADLDVRLKFSFRDNTAGATFVVALRGAGGWNTGRPETGLEFAMAGDATDLDVAAVSPGSVATMLGSSEWSPSVDTDAHVLRIQAVGDAVRWRVWLAEAPEPTAWDGEAVQTRVPGPGALMIGYFRTTGTHEVEIDDVTVSTFTAP